jgi:hypothetical protein
MKGKKFQCLLKEKFFKALHSLSENWKDPKIILNNFAKYQHLLSTLQPLGNKDLNQRKILG